MDSRVSRQAASKTGRKTLKLKLNKETLKDLTASDKDVKGGYRVPQETKWGTCSCAIEGC